MAQPASSSRNLEASRIRDQPAWVQPHGKLVVEATALVIARAMHLQVYKVSGGWSSAGSPDGDATGLWKTAMLMPHDDATWGLRSKDFRTAALLLTPHQDDLEFNQFRTDDELLKHGLHRDANYLHGLHRDANYLMPHDDVDRMKRPSRQRSSPRRDAGDDSNLQRSTLQASTSWR
eukprot:s2518_g10.t3